MQTILYSSGKLASQLICEFIGLYCYTAPLLYTAETLPWIIKILAGCLARINGRKDENLPVISVPQKGWLFQIHTEFQASGMRLRS